jgi:hypothetical protein
LLGLACARAEMHVGYEQRAKASRCFGLVHDADARQLRFAWIRPDRYVSRISIV